MWPKGAENGETGTFALEFLVSTSFIILVVILKDGLYTGNLQAASSLLKCYWTVTKGDNSVALLKNSLLRQTVSPCGQMSFLHMSSRWKHCSLTKLGLPCCSRPLSTTKKGCPRDRNPKVRSRNSVSFGVGWSCVFTRTLFLAEWSWACYFSYLNLGCLTQ